ncbi:Sterol uptake control protein [Paramyrothecium foliicola]|nr:Sterol uptake control protein [Paramyrothecium foliicola]
MEFSDTCLLQMELIHHYTTSTCLTSPHMSDRTIFRDEVPRLGIRYPYLLHQLLALSAFHCAYLHPESREKYFLHGSEHQTQAIAGMRSALTGKMTEESGFALFATSALLMTSTFASHLKYPQNEVVSPLAGMLEIMAMMRGLSAIKATTLTELDYNVSDKLIQHDGCQPHGDKLDPLKTQLIVLQSLFQCLLDIDDDIRAVVCEGVQLMLDCMDSTKTPSAPMSSEMRLVLSWLTRLPVDFTTMLQTRHPGAMVVLLHYLVALKEGEKQCWFLEGWSEQLTLNVVPLLYPPWTELAEWPLKELMYSGIKVQSL